MNWKRIIILACFDLRHSLFRLKGLVFLIPFLFFWYLNLKFLYERGGQALVSPESIVILSWLYNPEIAQILLLLYPPVLSVFLIMVLASTPAFAMLSGNDQLASDSGRQTFRFLLTRCTRSEIFAGRFLSHYLLISLSTLLIAAMATAISLHHDQYSTAAIIHYAGHISLLVLVYMLPFVAYMSVISALMSSALSALLMAVSVYIVLIILGNYLQYKSGVTIELHPGGLKEYLFDINPYDLYIGVGGLLAFTCIFICLGWLVFRKRNI
jgi:hypothetical protein